MSEMRPIGATVDVTSRWPGIADYDVDQAADFMAFCLTDEGEHLRDELYDISSNDPAIVAAQSLCQDASFRLRGQRDLDTDAYRTAAANSLFRMEESSLRDAIQDEDEELTRSKVGAFLNRWPFELQVKYQDSPLYPDGREIHVPIDLAAGQRISAPHEARYVANCLGEREEVHESIVTYIKTMNESKKVHDSTPIVNMAKEAAHFDGEQYERLRQAYGTKAANLLVFAEALASLNDKAKLAEENGWLATVSVPKFTVAPVDLYKLHQSQDERYESYLEQIRQQALGITDDTYDAELFRPIVAIRSSAVYSEDGENASGAGIYDSIAVDPRDQTAFRAAVEQVFNSVNSEQAKAYRASKCIPQELMGLVIQQYVENEVGKWRDHNYTYGFIRSTEPSGRFMTLSTKVGELLYDKQAVADSVMISQQIDHRVKPYTLHFVPDHDTDISYFAAKGSDAANAAQFAELLFGKPVELELVFNDRQGAQVVQVRPVPAEQTTMPEVSFPDGLEPLLTCRALGVGDVVVTIRNAEDEYEDGETQIDWVNDENREGARASWRDEDRVLIINYNDGYSGHIQMLAKERGQICLYPAPLKKLSAALDEYIGYNPQRPVRRLRIVSDGYKGAVYPVEYDPVAEKERAALLQRMANGLVVLASQKNLG